MNHTMLKLGRFLMIVFLLMASLAIPSGTARAAGIAVFTVNSISDAYGSDGLCTLREAIFAANLNSNAYDCISTGSGFGNDSIFFSLSGSTLITLTSNLPAIAPGSLSIYGRYNVKPVVIDGAGAFRAFDITSAATVVLIGLTVQHGSANWGGAVNNLGNLQVFDNSFLNNAAGGDGGAINNGGTLTISNSTFVGNSAAYGGALSNNGGTVTVLNSTFSGNTATEQGGALSTWQSGAIVPVTTVKNTIMANSTAPEDCWNGNGGTPTGDHNIIETTGGFGATTCSGITTSTADPMLGSLTGSPAYLPLLAGSPAKDAGDDATCANYPVGNTSQNGVLRPQDAHCEIGAFEVPLSATFTAVASQDGWILESSETSGTGGTLDSTDTQFNVGDGAADKQYRSILSFNTGPTLPDTAVIVGATLKLKKTATVGGSSPFPSLGYLYADIKQGPFSGNAALQLTDFYAAGSKNAVAKYTSASTTWISTNIVASGLTFVNRTGGTQIRLRFATDDNDNGLANYLRFASGNAITTSRPQLIITYYIP